MPSHPLTCELALQPVHSSVVKLLDTVRVAGLQFVMAVIKDIKGGEQNQQRSIH